MRQLILEAIRAIPNKEADSGRYMPVKRQLHEIRFGQAGWKDKTIEKHYNLDSFDYDGCLSDESLLAIFTTFCHREWTQR